MTKTKRRQASQQEAFHRHFSAPSRWGERWETSLYPALAKATRYVALCNQYVSPDEFLAAIASTTELHEVDLPSHGDRSGNSIRCLRYDLNEDHENQAQTKFPIPSTASNGLATHWNLDLASVLAVHMLDVQPDDRVLDLCAAPGGKSIAIAQGLWREARPAASVTTVSKGVLHSNEFDRSRQRRLDENLRQYLPQICLADKRVQCLMLDGTKGAQFFPLGVGGYDKVLLDAPCSSERHIIHAQEQAGAQRTAEELQRWSPSYAKRLAEVQVKLLLTAFRAVRIGGKVLYATCSISNEENDEVIEKVLRQIMNERKKGQIRWTVEVEGETAAMNVWAEKTNLGYIVLPDQTTPAGSGWGPLYFTTLVKQAAKD